MADKPGQVDISLVTKQSKHLHARANMQTLEKLIDGLVEFVNPRKNIHAEIKQKIGEIPNVLDIILADKSN